MDIDFSQPVKEAEPVQAYVDHRDDNWLEKQIQAQIEKSPHNQVNNPPPQSQEFGTTTSNNVA